MTGNIETIGIPLAFLGIITLILWYIISGSGKWWLKVLVIAATSYVSLGLWYSMNGLLGWPTSATVPDKFQAHWIVVETPGLGDKDSGAIFLWATNLQPDKSSNFDEDVPEWLDGILFPFHSKHAKNEPRLYKLPYSKKLHEQSNKIIENYLKKGRPFMGTMKGKGGKGQGFGEGQNGRQGTGQSGSEANRGRRGHIGQGNGSGSYSRDDQDAPMFYELPPPKFPKKDGEPNG